MQKRIVMVSLFILLVLGGFFVVKAMNGEATALNDSFTKEFIVEEFVEEDFHLFESKTGQYRMLFPNEFQMISEPPEFYGRRGVGFENWSAQIFGSNNGLRHAFQVKFTNDEVDLFNSRLNTMLGNYAYQDQYQELENDQTLIYHGSSFITVIDKKGVIKDPNKYEANSFFGLVRDKNSNKSIELYYSLTCFNEELGCSVNANYQYEFALKLMESIKFNN
ncbi:hypothetical protein A33I_10160 [Alkalihalophilus marmarensis DSM 21297]|uniref:Uncharacterized protein n=1 Tax=Alkalihalophilus marmarensis DSM 21297 TaxID=1188261 RepID=U6SQ74_9BACI|nr:hypothetical protein A33I_10160 [Alkalihalophilus marmarensis DSM 21297]